MASMGKPLEDRLESTESVVGGRGLSLLKRLRNESLYILSVDGGNFKGHPFIIEEWGQLTNPLRVYFLGPGT